MSQPNDEQASSDSQVTSLAAEMATLQLTTTPTACTININYDDYKHAKVPVKDSLRRLLVEEKSGLVIFGDENFTFSFALAAMCGSWDRIISTRYLPEDSKPQVAQVRLENIRYCISNGDHKDSSKIVQSIEKILSLPSPGVDTWRCGVDATNLPGDLQVQKKIVWYQCPWSTGNRDETGPLIREFLTQISGKLSHGDFVLIGIANYFPYVKSYQLQNLLGEGLEGPKAGPYHFGGGDNTLIKEILKFGYHHHAVRGMDIHEKILDAHLTLIFQRR